MSIKKSNLLKRCRLSKQKQSLLLSLFISGSTGRAAARIVGVNRNTAHLFFRKLRKVILTHKTKIGRGVVEVDETYLSSGEGGRKVAKQGRNLKGKIALVGVVDRNEHKVIIERVKSTNANTLENFCLKHIDTGSTIHTDSFRSYNHINQYGYNHLRVNHFLTFKNSKTQACTNLIESVWAFTKRFLGRFSGGWRNNLNLWLAEIAFRFETSDEFITKLKSLLRKARAAEV